MDTTAPDDITSGRVRDVVAIAGLAALGAGLVILAPTELGFDRAKALEALITWAPITVPPALLVLAVTALELLTGLILARLLLGRPLRDLTEALLAGFAGAVVKSVVLLGLLAGSGLFIAPVLVAADLLVIVAWLAGRRRADGGSVLPDLIDDARLPGLRISPFGVLLLVAWAPPIVKMLGAPVAPFLDILPNHVAPAEHLRAFGSMTSLTDTWSPIYGPSRTFLGYTALLGTITTISGLSAGAALAGFILPSTLLVATGVRHLARSIGGPGLVGWALLAFAASTSVARLGDARATVVVLPLVALALALAAAGGVPAGWRGAVASALTIGAAILVHPVIGALTALTVVLAVVLPVGRAVPTQALFAGLAGASIVALPQLTTMLGVGSPPIVLAAAVLAGGWASAGVAVVLPRLSPWVHGMPWPAGASPDPGAIGLLPQRVPVLLVVAGLAVAVAAPFGAEASEGLGKLLGALEVAVLLALVAVLRGVAVARSPVVVVAVALGAGVAILVHFVPEGTSLLDEALRFELPKTLQYWAPLPMALLAAAGLSALATLGGRIAGPTGIGVAAIAVITLALPLRPTPIDALHLGEYRWSETLSIAIGELERGYWRGFPDTRYVIDAPRREIVEAVRGEIAAGDIRSTTAVLHVASSFQQWTATPLGPFTGVAETIVSADAVTNIHTVGGRLFGFDELDRLLRSGDYGYVLFEPADDGDRQVPPDARDRILAAGYVPFFANAQGELFRTGG